MFRSFFLSRRWALWAWGGLFVLVALVFITVQQTVKLNAWYGEFYDLLQKPEQAGGLEKFWGFMVQFAWIAFPFHVAAQFGDVSGLALRLSLASGHDRAVFAPLAAHRRDGGGGFAAHSGGLHAFCPPDRKPGSGLGACGAHAGLLHSDFVGFVQGMAIAWLQFEGSLFWVAWSRHWAARSFVVCGHSLAGAGIQQPTDRSCLAQDLVYAEDERSRMDLPTVLSLFTGVRLNNFRLFNHYAYFTCGAICTARRW
jgi:peptide/bleomycin uptake transporter